MGWFLLIGLFCLLAVIGFFATGRPFKFALGGIILLVAIVFVLLIIIVVWTMAAPCSAPFTDHSSAYCQNQATSSSPNSGQSGSIPYTPNQSAYTSGQAPANTSATPSTQYPSGKCVTESGVQICDLSYQSTDKAGTTRTVTMPANEIICHDLTTGLNSDIQGNTATISTDPQFCASDYGAIYIDPTIDVSKYYGKIQSSGQNYNVPSTESECIWTYVGGSAAVPYIQAGSYIGPDTSYDQVHAFCQSSPNQLDIFTSLQ